MITCQYCKTKNKENEPSCTKCGAPFIDFTVTSGSPINFLLKPDGCWWYIPYLHDEKEE